MNTLPPPIAPQPEKHRQPLTASQLVEILAVIAAIIVVGVALLQVDVDDSAGAIAAAIMIAVVAVLGGAVWWFARWTTKRSNRKFAAKQGR